MKKMYFFIEDIENEKVSEILKKYDDDAEIELYNPVIKACNNDINICINHVIGFFIQNENKVSIVTDIYELYVILKQSFESCFESIEYVDSSYKNNMFGDEIYEDILRSLNMRMKIFFNV